MRPWRRGTAVLCAERQIGFDEPVAIGSPLLPDASTRIARRTRTAAARLLPAPLACLAMGAVAQAGE
ncbi:hypothetical protein CJP04_29090, partial [Klebsiella pneumoniae]